MIKDIDKLLEFHEYDLYNNEFINPDNLCQLAECFSKEHIEILEYFSEIPQILPSGSCSFDGSSGERSVR